MFYSFIISLCFYFCAGVDSFGVHILCSSLFIKCISFKKKDGKLLLSNHLKADTCGSELICVLLIWSQLLHYASFCHIQIQSSQRQDNKLQVTDLTSKTGP